MDGNKATEELRRMGCKIPIIGVSAHAMKEYREVALSAGMDDYLIKPISLDELECKLDSLQLGRSK